MLDLKLTLVKTPPLLFKLVYILVYHFIKRKFNDPVTFDVIAK